MNCKVKVKMKGREVSFSSQSEMFRKIAMIAQSRLADSIGTMIRTKKTDLFRELELDTIFVNSFTNSSTSIIDKMALVQKAKCA